MNYAVSLTKEQYQKQCAESGVSLPYAEEVSVLAAPLTVAGKKIPNRLACQAMEGCDGTVAGEPGELTLRRYRRFAEGGAGLLWFEATAVMPEGRANPRQLYLCEDTLDAFKRTVADIKETALRKNGREPVIVMQATHSGRYAKPNGDPEPLIAYHNPIFEEKAPIADNRIVTDDYLDRVGERLIAAAALAERAGFDGVDIKCCHRYLNSELLSAYTRPGKYGGSFENRTRLLTESVKGAIAATGRDFLVTSRLNIYDGFAYPNGFGVATDGSTAFDPTEPIALVRHLFREGVRLLNITMGNPYFNPHVNRPYAHGAYPQPEHPLVGVARVLSGTAAIKQAVPDMTLLCSALTYLGVAAPHVAAGFIGEGGFDLAGFGRTAFAYPDFAADILENGALDPKKCCLGCSKCTEIMRRKGGTPGCVIRDRAVYLPIYQQLCGGK